MTDPTPTPTRAEVERDLLMAVLLGAQYRVDLDWLHKHGMEGATALGERAAELTIAMRDERDAPRDRAEAAEADQDRLRDAYIEAQVSCGEALIEIEELQKELTEARALRRAAPTEGEA